MIKKEVQYMGNITFIKGKKLCIKAMKNEDRGYPETETSFYLLTMKKFAGVINLLLF